MAPGKASLLNNTVSSRAGRKKCLAAGCDTSPVMVVVVRLRIINAAAVRGGDVRNDNAASARAASAGSRSMRRRSAVAGAPALGRRRRHRHCTILGTRSAEGHPHVHLVQ